MWFLSCETLMFFRPSPDPEIATQPKTAEALQSVQAHRQYQDHVTPMDVVSIQQLKETGLTLTQKLFNIFIEPL